jgi:hypothetical protein
MAIEQTQEIVLSNGAFEQDLLKILKRADLDKSKKRKLIKAKIAERRKNQETELVQKH